ncbi:MAG: SufE family protein [Hyphomicrobiales bacterium]
MSIDDILADFEVLDDWESRYGYVIELGKALPAFPGEAHTDANKVEGCVSQVWLKTIVDKGGDGPVLTFIGDSDALIVRGIIAILIALYSGRPAREILETDAGALLEQLGLDEALSRQRSNGLVAMVKRIKGDAQAALAAA